MTVRRAVFAGVVSCAVACGLTSCGAKPEPPVAESGSSTAGVAPSLTPAPTLEDAKHAAYSGVEEAGEPFTLVNGKWAGPPVVPGAASAPSVTFVRDFRMTGDVDGDGAEEAVVLLAGGTGGSGEMSYLAVLGRRGGRVVNVATAPLGDRVQVRDARIDKGTIVLHVVQAGERDAACCPGDLVSRNWTLDGTNLREGAAVRTGRLGIDTIAGVEWVLRWWDWEEQAPAAPAVTLRLDGDRLAGSAGCNAYTAPVRAVGRPGNVTVGPPISTRKMCPETDMAAEKRFLEQLGGVTRLGFVAGELALTYTQKDKSFGVMLFDRRPAPPAQ